MSLTLCLCCCSVAKLCLTLRLHGLQHSRLFCPSLSPGVCSDSCPLIWWCFLTIASSDTYLCVWCVYIHIYKCIYASNILWKNGGGEAEGIKILVVYWNDILADRSHIWLNSLLVAGEKSSLALAEAMCDLTISPHRWGEVFSSSAWGRRPQSGPGGVRVSHWAFCTELAAPLLLPLPLVPRVEGPLVTDTWLQTETHPLVFSIIFRFRGELCATGKRKQTFLWFVEGTPFASGPCLCSLVGLLLPSPLLRCWLSWLWQPVAFSSVFQPGSHTPNASRDIRIYNSDWGNG